MIALAFLLFMEFFTRILNGTTILVAFLLSMKESKDLPRSSIFKVSDLAINILGQNLPRVVLRNQESDASAPPQLTDSRAGDEIERQLQRNIERSKDAARVAERRPNALLFVGTVVAGVGLLFFLVTLPGFITKTDVQGGIEAADLWRRVLDLVPRLLMLVFIQLLAGFFLTKYRSAMEEFRYYEEILRFREAQLISYMIRRDHGDKDVLRAYGKEVLEDRNFLRVPAGPTTISEAHKDANDFKDFISAFLDFARNNRFVNPEKPASTTTSGHEGKGPT